MHDRPVETVTIAGSDLSAEIVTIGASLRSLQLEGVPFSLVLGYPNIESYRENTQFLGAIAGRFANRISNGTFALDGRTFELDRNDGAHTLHGGRAGTWARSWQIVARLPNSVTLVVIDSGEETGFPGDCLISATYAIPEPGVIEIVLVSRCDQPTPCSLAPHPYFTLDGSGDIRDHEVRIDADRYLPVDRNLIPTGEVASVEGTPFDLRDWRRMDHLPEGYDNHFCTEVARSRIRGVAEARSPASRISMKVETTEPGLQFYTGRGLMPPFARFSGVCLEPHIWPDAPNRENFPDCVVRPGQEMLQRTRYTFTRY